MFRNYLKIAWRSLKKNKVFTFINVFGLSIGLTCCLLISLYIYHETSYDSYHKNASRLVQLGTTFIRDGKAERTPNCPAPMAAAMQQEFPEIEKTTRLMKLFAEDKTLLQYNPQNGPAKTFYETKGYMADSTFFQLFSYQFIEGNPATALGSPNTVVLSEEIAKKLFGNEPALNKTISISSNTNGDTTFTVAGVYKPFKKPSQIDARFFVSIRGGRMEPFINQQTDMLNNNMFHTFFLLKPGATAASLQAKFPLFVEKYMKKDMEATKNYKSQFLLPVTDMHLHSNMKANITPVGSMTSLYVLGSIALFTLLIACINFMNLSTARSSKRSAEVGVRKVLGADRSSLIKQFMGESIVMSLIAFLLAIVFALLLLPGFSFVSGRELQFSLPEHVPLLAGFFCLALLTGLFAGSYPAFYLSSFKPIKVLKSRFSNSMATLALRKGLVVFQFMISVVLIIAAVVIGNQMRYMQTKDLGFSKDQQIVIPLRSNTSKNIYTALKNEVKRNDGVLQVGASFYYPGIMNPSDILMRKEGQSLDDQKDVFLNTIDENFLQTLDIKPLAGRLFSEQFPGDTAERIIVNAEAIKQLGFASAGDAVGKTLLFDWRGETHRFPIVGVVKDFHFQDLRVPILPYGFFLNNRTSYNYLVVHANTGNLSSLLKNIGASWHKLNPNEPFEYSFMDEDFQKNYDGENKLQGMVDSFTIIAILISCLGLFGLATFSAEQRIKEIGIRKVLGASVSSLVGLLSKEFVRLVLIALVIASPIAWFVMNKWLEDFAYRTSIGWWVFATTGVTALVIALITVSFQAVKAALTNPVKNLRTE
ncbi:ABC transporter permease [Flavisolibacter nicotianae]|uniref:ABC transporter permease n=1 Tax=Flavisolibacter nicotianae TaxID=2364882 RepID=UPI000EB1E7F9|nr:ABC transporter permease [Flavisolibacter nicotianae]